MARQKLCWITAALLASLSLAFLGVRLGVLGEEVAGPLGPGTYRVTVVVRGKAADGVKLTTACPLDLGRQHIFAETYYSQELAPSPPEHHRPERRLVHWTPLLPGWAGAFTIRYEFSCQVLGRRGSRLSPLGQKLYGPPGPEEYLGAEPRLEVDDPLLGRQAQALVQGLEQPVEQVRALYDYVSQEIVNEPTVAGVSRSARDCLQAGRGDAVAKSRLLVALCRARRLPARLVTGLVLSRSGAQQAHVWAEVWVGDQWLSVCPFHRHFGRVPATYLVFALGDQPLVQGHNLRALSYACLAEHQASPEEDAAQVGWLRRFFRAISLYNLPPAETALVEFLLLLPLAALIICLFRNVVGLGSFGTFAPALIGLAFRHAGSLPGLLIFLSLVLVGWGLRRFLDRYHLLQVPRVALLLSLVVSVLLAAIVLASMFNLSPTRYVSLFPMIILTSMIERFWTLEAEDGTWASFKTLGGTVIIALTISLVLGVRGVAAFLFRYPEMLGVIMALQLLLGRYTGYRLSELWRFRDLVRTAGSTLAAVGDGPAAASPRVEETRCRVWSDDTVCSTPGGGRREKTGPRREALPSPARKDALPRPERS
jgi:hypothetical protein